MEDNRNSDRSEEELRCIQERKFVEAEQMRVKICAPEPRL